MMFMPRFRLIKHAPAIACLIMAILHDGGAHQAPADSLGVPLETQGVVSELREKLRESNDMNAKLGERLRESNAKLQGADATAKESKAKLDEIKKFDAKTKLRIKQNIEATHTCHGTSRQGGCASPKLGEATKSSAGAKDAATAGETTKSGVKDISSKLGEAATSSTGAQDGAKIFASKLGEAAKSSTGVKGRRRVCDGRRRRDGRRRCPNCSCVKCPSGWWNNNGHCKQACPSNSQSRHSNGRCMCGYGGHNQSCNKGFHCSGHQCLDGERLKCPSGWFQSGSKCVQTCKSNSQQRDGNGRCRCTVYSGKNKHKHDQCCNRIFGVCAAGETHCKKGVCAEGSPPVHEVGQCFPLRAKKKCNNKGCTIVFPKCGPKECKVARKVPNNSGAGDNMGTTYYTDMESGCGYCPLGHSPARVYIGKNLEGVRQRGGAGQAGSYYSGQKNTHECYYSDAAGDNNDHLRSGKSEMIHCSPEFAFWPGQHGQHASGDNKADKLMLSQLSNDRQNLCTKVSLVIGNIGVKSRQGHDILPSDGRRRRRNNYMNKQSWVVQCVIWKAVACAYIGKKQVCATSKRGDLRRIRQNLGNSRRRGWIYRISNLERGTPYPAGLKQLNDAHGLCADLIKMH